MFLVLTVYSLERERWAQAGHKETHVRWKLATAFLILNAIAVNLWIGQISNWRIDTTKGQQHTLSDATRNYLQQLQGPLTLRGYFSAKTHPLLSPLVPQMRDLLSEYEVAGNGRVRVEIVDPLENPDIEAEANQQFGIEPVPFQVADRYQSSIVSSYFDVLVQYGDEYDVLGFRDLIDVKSQSETDIDVQLRNPEYDLTRSIRKVLTDFQSAGNVFNSIDNPITLAVYASTDDRLPSDLISFKSDVETIANRLAGESQGKLTVDVIDPNANGGEIANKLVRNVGLRPLSAGLFSTEKFWFHMLLEGDRQLVQIPLGDLSTAALESNLDKGLERFAKGFTKKIGLVVPPADNPGAPASRASFRRLEEFLRAEYDVVREDLSDGRVANEIDLLLLAAPKELDEKSLFAVDQFLMQGGTVVASTSNWQTRLSRNRLDLQSYESGLMEWLEHNGITIGDEMVMDPQNAAFPAPVTRNVAGMQLQEMRMLDYPWFVDVRRDGMDTANPIIAGIEQVNMTWASPVQFSSENANNAENAVNAENADNADNADNTDNTDNTDNNTSRRESSVLLSSSSKSWLSRDTDIMPRVDANGQGISPWTAEGDVKSQPLAVAAAGRFESFFAGKTSPLVEHSANTSTAADVDSSDDVTNGIQAIDELTNDLSSARQENSLSGNSAEDVSEDASDAPSLSESIDSVIEHSPESARLIVFASNDFLRDQITQMTGSSSGTAYLAPYQLVANAIDVALDDTGLLGIRSRGQFNRTLPPMDDSTKRFWDYLNYALAALAIFALYIIARFWHRRKEHRQLAWLAS